MNEEASAKIELDKDKALVLFEWLGKLDSLENTVDAATFIVFSEIESQLEPQIDAAFSSNYLQLVEESKSRVIDTNR